MADNPLLDMFGDIPQAEGNVIQEIGAISSGGPQYNTAMNDITGGSAVLAGQSAIPGLPQASSRPYGHMTSRPQMAPDRTKMQPVPGEYPGAAAANMQMPTQYGSMGSHMACNSDSAHPQQPTIQHRYAGGMMGGHQYRSQQYPYPHNQQYEGMQYSAGMMQQPQHARSVTPGGHQTQQYPNTWSSSSQQYVQQQSQQTRMPLQSQHSYLNYNAGGEPGEPQATASHQQVSHYPTSATSGATAMPSQQHIPRPQMSMYHQTSYPQSSQQNSYNGVQSHPSISQQQISGYPQTTQSQQPSNSYYNNTGIGARPTNPHQQHSYGQLPGQYPASSHISTTPHIGDQTRFQHYSSSSGGSHNVLPQNGGISQSNYYQSQGASQSLIPANQQQFRPPAQPDPHIGSALNIPNGTQTFRSPSLSPRRPTPPASGSISPMPTRVKTPERHVVGNMVQSPASLPQGFASPRQHVSPNGQVSPVPVSQQTSLQQLEQMVMPGPKLADKPDVGSYSQLAPLPIASPRNGPSPSYGMNHPAAQLHNISRTNMDGMSYSGMSPLMSPNSQNLNSVPQTVSSSQTQPTILQHQPRPIPKNDNCQSVPIPGNLQQAVPPMYNNMDVNIVDPPELKDVYTNEILLPKPAAPKLPNLTPEVSLVSESHTVQPISSSSPRNFAPHPVQSFVKSPMSSSSPPEPIMAMSQPVAPIISEPNELPSHTPQDFGCPEVPESLPLPTVCVPSGAVVSSQITNMTSPGSNATMVSPSNALALQYGPSQQLTISSQHSPVSLPSINDINPAINLQNMSPISTNHSPVSSQIPQIPDIASAQLLSNMSSMMPIPQPPHLLPIINHPSPPKLTGHLQPSVPRMPAPPQLSLAEAQFPSQVGPPQSSEPDLIVDNQQKVCDIQQMQNKIQSLCTLPPTPIINQQVCELQERIRSMQRDQPMPPHGPCVQPAMSQATPHEPILPNQVLNPGEEMKTPDGSSPTSDKKAKRTPRRKKEKPKTPKESKEPKTPKTPRTPKTPKRSKKKKPEVKVPLEVSPDQSIDVADAVVPVTVEEESSALAIDVVGDAEPTEPEIKSKPKKRAKARVTRPKSRASAKKKPLKLPINFGKKKKRRRGSDFSDGEGSPPPTSPKSEDESIQKRRSSRNTKRKKYIDDIDMNLIDDESGDNNPKDDEDGDAVLIKPTQFYKTFQEDELIVEKIFNHRMGTRIIEYVDDEDELETKEQVTEQVVKPQVDTSNEAVVTKDEVDVEQKPAEDAVEAMDTSSAPDIKEKKPVQVDEPKKDESQVISEAVDPDDDAKDTKDEKEPEDPAKVAESDEKPIQSLTSKKIHTETIEVEEFYVKFKNFSHLHCEWRTFEELEKGDKRMAQKMKRYRQKRAQASFLEDFDEEPFNPLYLEVDRVLDMSEGHETENGPSQRHFLVKWQGTSYEESTWELEQDVDQCKIQQYMKFKDPPEARERKTRKQLKVSEWKKMEETSVYNNCNKLREYQLEGVNWITFCTYNEQNCILADEMGLGKTIQSIAYLVEIKKCGLLSPYLVIAPLSTIGNWQREFETWSDLNVIVYHGSTASRNMIQEYEMYYKDEDGNRIENLYKFEVMITTFEIVITDVLELREVPWKCCIIDEAHRLKNKNCKLLEGLRLIEMEQRVLLTGTPLQNNVEELFSLLNFLEPVLFSSQETFLAEFGDLKTEGQVEKLQSILKPMMLRRLKEDVEKSLAPKEETIVEVELTNVQKKYYRAILERNFAFLSKGSCSNANVPNLMNTMMELRKCCIHPYLITGAEDQITKEYKLRHEDEDDASFHAMVNASGKLVLLDKLLPKLKDGGHRVLIFSQMVRCLDLLEDYLVHKRYLYERIDGRVRGNLRQAAIDRYSKPDSDRFVFLLCTRAGGLGINLTAADTVVIFDSDWNPQNDLQAQARCHRIGQEKAVKIYRLICRNTYEREMFDKASLKLGLDKAVLQSMSCSNNKEGPIPSQQLTKKEIEDLLKKGAYGALMEDDNAGDQFCEEDIDQILQRRTQVIQLEAGVKGSKFAKASFSSADTRTDINIDDPEFWQKWAKKADVDLENVDGKNELIMKEPRRRTQTRRYGNEELVMDISDLESSDDDSEAGLSRGRGGRLRRSKKLRGKNPDDDFYYGESYAGSWSRADCHKIERGLLTFGWGRWHEILAHSFYKRNINEKNIEDMARAVLLYCSKYFHGDEQIKSFIIDLITPYEDGQIRLYKNHLGLSGPVSRGRKSRKSKKDKQFPEVEISTDWISTEKHDPELKLADVVYKKHLQRQANRVLLRVRTLYYIRQEVIGGLALQIAEGVPASELPLLIPATEGDAPSLWWDSDADKSVLVGIYKHGYNRYNVMRQDPTLCFLARCGPPDGAALLAEISNGNDDFIDIDKGKDEIEEDPLSPVSPNTTSENKSQDRTPISVEPGKAVFPAAADLNTRLRRVITSYQRNHKKMELRLAQEAKRLEKREKIEAAFREREVQKRQLQQRRWSRREESDFYKTVAAFGVVYLVNEHRYDWNKFRTIARLEKKFDDTLTEYFKAFYAMCKRVCGKKLNREEEQLPLIVEPITEERASRCLQRIDLLNNLRENIVNNPKIEERLKLCQPAMDLPDWWICGKHDKDLLKGCAKHGLYRTDFHLLHDSTLCFRDVIKNLGKVKSEKEREAVAAAASTPPPDLKDCADVKKQEGIAEQKDEAKPSEKIESDVKFETESKVEKVTDAKTESIVKVEQEVADVPEKKDEPEGDSKCEKEAEEQVQESSEAKEEDEVKSDEVEVKNREHETIVEDKPDEEKPTQEEECDTKDAPDEVKDEEVQDLKKVADKENQSSVKERSNSEKPEEDKREVVDKKLESLKIESMKQETDDDDRLDVMSQDSVTTAQYNNDDALSQSSFSMEIDVLESSASQSLNNSSNLMRWPKDKVLQMRLEQVCHVVEKNEWPSPRQLYMCHSSSNTPSNQNVSAVSRSPTPSLTRSSTPQDQVNNTTPDHFKLLTESFKHHDLYGLNAMAQLDQYAMTMKQNQDNMNMMKRRGKKRRRNDVEAERAKLRALLSQSLQAAMSASPTTAFNRSLENMRRSFPGLDTTAPFPPTPGTSILKNKSSRKSNVPTRNMSTPPPAHQHSSSKVGASPLSSGTLDLSKKLTSEPPSTPTSASADWAMDLSSTSSATGSPSTFNKSTSLLNKSKVKSKQSAGNIVNGEAPSARSRPSIDDLALNLQFKKKKKMKEENSKVSDTKREDKLGDFDVGSNKSNFYPIDAAAQFLSKPGYHPSSATAASLLSEYKLASSFPFSNRGSNDRSASPGDVISDYLESKRKKKRPKLDPQLLDINDVTGDENISVVNRLTGKRLTGSKAPTLRELPLWLEQNPMFDVESKWSQVVKEKGRLPDKLKKRLISPVDKKKKLGIYSDYTSPLVGNPSSTSSILTSTSNSVNAMAGLAGMGSLPLLSGFPGVKNSTANNTTSPMFLPFGGLANLGLAANPFFNLANYGFPNIPGLGANIPQTEGGKSGGRSGSSKSSDKKSSGGSSGHAGNHKSSHGPSSKSSAHKNATASNNGASSSATSSLPFLFPNPGLLYNPMALGGFNLQQNLPTSFASLAQSGLLNSLVTPSAASSSSSTTLISSSPLSAAKPTSTVSSSSTLTSHPLMQDDSDDESLKSLMGNHDDDDFPDDDEFDVPPPTEPTKNSESSTQKLDSKTENETSSETKSKSGSNS